MTSELDILTYCAVMVFVGGCVIAGLRFREWWNARMIRYEIERRD